MKQSTPQNRWRPIFFGLKILQSTVNRQSLDWMIINEKIMKASEIWMNIYVNRENYWLKLEANLSIEMAEMSKLLTANA